MTKEEILDAIEAAISESRYSQIWDKNLEELIDNIRERIAEPRTTEGSLD